jgi:hypothetical protein
MKIFVDYPGESSDRTNTIRNVRSELSDALHAKNPRPEKVVADTRQNQNRVTDHPMPSESWGSYCVGQINRLGGEFVTANLIRGYRAAGQSPYRVEITFHWDDRKKKLEKEAQARAEAAALEQVKRETRLKDLISQIHH